MSNRGELGRFKAWSVGGWILQKAAALSGLMEAEE